MVAVDPSPAGVVVEPAPPAAGDVDDVGLALDDAAALVTVTVGALTNLVALAPLLFAVSAALNLIVSAGAFFGTVTCISTCGVGGCLAGRLRAQVLVLVLVHVPAVKAVLSAVVVTLGFTATTIEPSAATLLQAAIRNSTVPPAWTVVAEAVTVMSAAGVAGGVVLPEPVGVGVAVGVEVGGSVALPEPPEPELEPEPLVEPVLLGVGEGVGVALVVGSLALGELDA